MELATIRHFYDVIDARIAAGRLEAAGIPAHLQYVNHLSVDWLVGAALGGVPLQVPEALANEAMDILAEDAALQADEDLCPSCGSSNTFSRLLRWRITMILFHTFFLPLPWGKARRKCRQCGHVWDLASDD